MLKSLRCLLVAACLLVGPLAFSADPAPENSSEVAQTAALAWLKLVDAGDYAGSWGHAAAFFQRSVPEAKWVGALGQVRHPLGAVQSRQLKSATFTQELPRAPKGEYWLITFGTVFDGDFPAKEVLAVAHEANGAWRVVSYAIKPAAQ